MKTAEPNEEIREGSFIFMAWLLQNRKISDLINRLSDEDLKKEVSPGRNSGLYLLGHLIAANDLLMPLFGFGEKMFPEYEKIFLCTPDKCSQKFPPTALVKSHWFALNNTLRLKFETVDNKTWIPHDTFSSERLNMMLA
jgi:hypothetical protein